MWLQETGHHVDEGCAAEEVAVQDGSTSMSVHMAET